MKCKLVKTLTPNQTERTNWHAKILDCFYCVKLRNRQEILSVFHVNFLLFTAFSAAVVHMYLFMAFHLVLAKQTFVTQPAVEIVNPLHAQPTQDGHIQATDFHQPAAHCSLPTLQR